MRHADQSCAFEAEDQGYPAFSRLGVGSRAALRDHRLSGQQVTAGT
jgi:hypothetical protein